MLRGIIFGTSKAIRRLIGGLTKRSGKGGESVYSHCPVCLCSRSGDVIGQPCSVTPNCPGIITKQPEWKDLVDALPEPMTCGRRFDSYMGSFQHGDRGKDLDHWDKFKSNGNRVCSFCGSLHPDDFLALVKQSAEVDETTAVYTEVVRIEPSSKSYKVYVNQPGVRNAHEGGIKFYTQHLPVKDGKPDLTPEQQADYRKAVYKSKVLFERYLAHRFPQSSTGQSGRPTIN